MTHPITRAQFHSGYARRVRPGRCAEVEALLELPFPGGMAIPCRWRHFGHNVCGDYPLTYCSKVVE